MLRSKHTKVARTQENSGLGKARETGMEKNPEEVVREILSFDTAKEVFEFLDATYLSIKSAYLVLQDLRKCGAQQRCIDVGIWARDVKMPLRNIHYTVLLGACRDLKDVKQAELFLHEMADRKEANLINYNAFFAVCAAARDLERAMRVFEDMKQIANIHPDKVTFSTLFQCTARRGWQLAAGPLAVQQDAKQPQDSPRYRFVWCAMLLVNTLASLIKILHLALAPALQQRPVQISHSLDIPTPCGSRCRGAHRGNASGRQGA
eukprot:5717542-Pyramimonas_sp.AAC.1